MPRCQHFIQNIHLNKPRWVYYYIPIFIFKFDVDKSTFVCYNEKCNNHCEEGKKIKNILESGDRFERFALLIDTAHKGISRVKQNIVANTPVKKVHTMWLYKLLKHKDGLTASELAAESMIDRSLISRELASLAADGYITIDSQGKKRGYNSRIRLTEKGKQIADKIATTAYESQQNIGAGVPDEDLVVFYRTLEKICSNFEELEKEEKEN